MVRRFAESGVTRTSKRVGFDRFGDREELFLFKEERLAYLHDLILFLLRHDRFSSIPHTSNKNCNEHTKFLYHCVITHVIGGEKDTKYPVEVYTGNKYTYTNILYTYTYTYTHTLGNKDQRIDHHKLWEPATFNKTKTTVTLVTDGRYRTLMFEYMYDILYCTVYTIFTQYMIPILNIILN